MSEHAATSSALPRGIPDDRPPAGGGDQDDSTAGSAPVAFRLSELREWGIAAYAAAGMSTPDAATVVDNQLWSDRRGVDTHGFQRISWYVEWFRDGTTDPKAQCEVVSRTPSVLVADGHHGLGQLVITRFMEQLIDAASASGLVAGVIRNSNDWGCGANYPYRAAEAGFVCYGTTTSVPNLAPFGSRRKLFGNNPIVWTFPRRGRPPIVLDMAVTPVALGKVLRARSEGTDIPAEWGFLDRDGNPTVDPDAAMRGIVPAIGGYKGIGMVTASNIVAGILAGSAHTGDVAVGRRGQFFLLMDPGVFGDRERYYDDIEDMVAQVRAAGEHDALPGQTVYLPGELEQLEMDRRSAAGTVSYPPSVVRSLRRVGDDLGVAFECAPVPGQSNRGGSS
ncbi:Ldh family oxidoreductase [Candidatus Poriferisodalis sp.]|uniref:Ldh family oxidoreductase n=1 Tax=Candidatus Poriferisodalis sp. TaxID=3101277 RepID=UPI003B02AD0B